MTGPATAAIDRLLQAGFAQQQKGHLGQARAHCAQVLEIDRRNFEAVRRDEPSNIGSLRGLSGVCKFKAGDPFFDASAERLRDTALTPEPREQLHHGGTKISNDAGLSDQAKAHFAISNPCRPEGGWTVFRSR